MGRLSQISSTPLPQLLPHLHQRLDLARARKMVVEKAAIAVCLLVEFPDGWQAEMREVVTKLLEVLLAQHLCLTLVETPGHAGGNSTIFAFISPCRGSRARAKGCRAGKQGRSKV